MSPKLCLLPAFCLAFAALLLAPARPGEAFSLLGSNLSVNERHARVFDNFADASANDNTTPSGQFPGQTGAELALWKGIVEWGSLPHGDGSGDSTQTVLGSGGANFDAFWAGAASAIGSSASNVVSKVNSCSSGVLAYCEAPIETGWRIRFCESWTWNDGPGSIPGGHFDLQGVMAHEYGHALGLGHSTVGNATMFPSVGSGVTDTRSIEADDVAGVQAIYGVRAPTKPTIVATVAQGGTLTIHGTGFTAENNQVWFRPSAASSPDSDPRLIVSGLSSNGARLTLPIPAGAAPGDVLVKVGVSGHVSVSNAFPTDLVGTFGTPPVAHPAITSVSPATIDALIPGSAQSITLTGADLDLASAVLLDGVALDPTRYTIVNASTITLDMPQASSLGDHKLGVSDGIVTDEFTVTIVAPALPKLEVGSGDPFNVVDRDDGLPMIVSGRVGSLHRVLASFSPVPSSNAYVSLDLGNGFSQIFVGVSVVIPASGWALVTFPPSALFDPGPGPGLTFYNQTVDLTFPTPFDVSNLQTMVLVQ
jgi:hypothetical protein